MPTRPAVTNCRHPSTTSHTSLEYPVLFLKTVLYSLPPGKKFNGEILNDLSVGEIKGAKKDAELLSYITVVKLETYRLSERGRRWNGDFGEEETRGVSSVEEASSKKLEESDCDVRGSKVDIDNGEGKGGWERWCQWARREKTDEEVWKGLEWSGLVSGVFVYGFLTGCQWYKPRLWFIQWSFRPLTYKFTHHPTVRLHRFLKGDYVDDHFFFLSPIQSHVWVDGSTKDRREKSVLRGIGNSLILLAPISSTLGTLESGPPVSLQSGRVCSRLVFRFYVVESNVQKAGFSCAWFSPGNGERWPGESFKHKTILLSIYFSVLIQKSLFPCSSVFRFIFPSPSLPTSITSYPASLCFSCIFDASLSKSKLSA